MAQNHELTPREREVLDLIRRGLTNEEIAQRLDISLAGAKYHVSSILSKLGVETREEAAMVVAPETRRWTIAWPLVAAAAAGSIAIAGTLGIAAVLVATDSDGEQTSGAPMLADSGVQFRVCAANPDWVRPSIHQILSDENPMYYYIRGATEDGIREGHELRIYEVIPGSSVNQGWLAVSGLRGVIDPPGCPDALTRGQSSGGLALFALAQYEPVAATRTNDDVVLTVREIERGWTDVELTLEPPLSKDYSISFMDEQGAIVARYPTGSTNETGQISWEEAVELILDCQVTRGGQAHSLEVALVLKDGSRRRTIEPRLDDVFAVISMAQSECGLIEFATE